MFGAFLRSSRVSKKGTIFNLDIRHKTAIVFAVGVKSIKKIDKRLYKGKIQYICRLINNRGREPHKLIIMPVKIRLQRHGKKGKPFYWIVAADARSKRDGKYLEKLGTYNPNFNPSSSPFFKLKVARRTQSFYKLCK